MRGFCAAMATGGCILVAAMSQAAAEPFSEATGNWAGTSNGGFYFRAALEQNEDSARLMIWNGLDAIPSRDGPAEFDVARFALSAFAREQKLVVDEGPEGSTLQVITDFADEVAEGREVISIQYLDFQYTIVGYDHRSEDYLEGGGTEAHHCQIDFSAGTVTEDGVTRNLPPMDFEARNASQWGVGAAYERGWCSLGDSAG